MRPAVFRFSLWQVTLASFGRYFLRCASEP